MATIQRLTLKNYKSFREMTLEMRPLNILIGPNGAGKSNLLSFFRLLKNAADEKLAETIISEGGFDEIRWRGATDFFDTIMWELHVSELIGMGGRKFEPIWIRTSLQKRGSAGYGIFDEIGRVGTKPYRGVEDTYYLKIGSGHIAVIAAPQFPDPNRKIKQLSKEELDRFSESYHDQELYIAQVRGGRTYSVFDGIRSFFVDFDIFRAFSDVSLHNMRNAQPLQVITPLRVDPAGKNLVSVLYAIWNDARYAQSQEAIENALRDAFPEYRELKFPSPASGRVELHWREKNGWQFPAAQMSDGMLRYLGLATLLNLPEPPPLIAIDEPEIGLHPSLLHLLAGLLKVASSRSQIVVCTHSPQLLNADDIEPDDVVLVERRDGETVMERVSHRRDLNLWLERYKLGELQVLGKLELQA